MERIIFGQSSRLKQEREKSGFSQAALAARLGVSKQTVQNWEGAGGGEKATPIPSDKLGLCGSLGFDIQYVVMGVPSANLLQVAEEASAYRAEEKPLGRIAIETETLSGVIAGVDEYLSENDLEMPSDEKARLIVLLLRHIDAKTAADSDKVKSATAEIIQFAGRTKSR